MPHFRKYQIDRKDITELPVKKLSMSICAYYDYILLNHFTIGQYGEAMLYADETIISVSMLLSAACERNNLGVEIISEHREIFIFQVNWESTDQNGTIRNYRQPHERSKAMPNVRPMPDIEIAAIQKKGSKGGKRKVIEEEYDRLLKPYDVGSFCTVDLTEDEVSQKQTIKKRLNSAAERRGFVLHFIRSAGPLLRFEVKPREPDKDATDVFSAAQPEQEDVEAMAPINNGRRKRELAEQEPAA